MNKRIKKLIGMLMLMAVVVCSYSINAEASGSVCANGVWNRGANTSAIAVNLTHTTRYTQAYLYRCSTTWTNSKCMASGGKAIGYYQQYPATEKSSKFTGYYARGKAIIYKGGSPYTGILDSDTCVIKNFTD